MTTSNVNFTDLAVVASSVGLIEKDEMLLPLEENITKPNIVPNTLPKEQWRVTLNITEFRKDPMYSINFNWFRFIAIGVVPFLLLVYFNTQIYLGKFI